MSRQSKYTAEQIVAQVKNSGGFVTEIARRLEVSRRTVYNYKEKYATVTEAIFEEKEGLLDLAESELLRQVRAGHMTAIIFYLKTQGKGRGYIERQEFTGKDGGTLQIEYINDWRKAEN